jgi:ABC-type molybdate transport system ATPase subunit
MPEAPIPPPLTIQVKHRLGKLVLDLEFNIERWPALLFGPSGAGKSTLLRILAGLEKPREARISFGDQVLIDTGRHIRQRPGAGRVQMVTRRAALFPHLTVRQNIAFALQLNRKIAPQIVDSLLRLFHIHSLENRSPQMLSGGETQRVAIARALAAEPQLLLLDEAFTGLDTELKQEILGDLGAWLAERNVAVLHVSHEVIDALTLQAQVFVLRHGKLKAHGKSADVLAAQKAFLQELLQSDSRSE